MKNNLHEAFADEFKNIGKIIEHVGVCMMTTAAPTGGLCSRPMHVQELDPEGNLWFFASNHSHLIEEIRKVPVVNITFASSEKSKFISASGIAYEAFDKSKMEDLWNQAYQGLQ